jgi:fumarylpyruvate hydrolase
MNTEFAFQLPAPLTLPIHERHARVPVGDVWCVGRNYAAHAREMGSDPTREAPCFFAKARSGVLPGGGTLRYPAGTRELHHELELVVVLGRPLAGASEREAAAAVFGLAVGLDMTRRDLQAYAKERSWPWDVAKGGFPGSAPVGAVVPVQELPTRGALTLSVDGEVRQRGDLADLIWSIPELLARLSEVVTLGAGDLVFTGTPSGVGPVRPGQRMVGQIDGLPDLLVEVAAP